MAKRRYRKQATTGREEATTGQKQAHMVTQSCTLSNQKREAGGKQARQAAFLKAYRASLFNISEACRQVGLHRRTYYHWRTPEQIKAATGHNTTRSFSRYFMIDADDLRKTYSIVANQGGGKEVAKGLKNVSG